MSKVKEMPDRFVRCPTEQRFVVKNLLDEDDRPMRDADDQPLTYTWRQMIVTLVMNDPRLMAEGPLQLDHLERSELMDLARAKPGEVVRVSGRPLECLQKVLLTSPVFDASTNGVVMHGYMAQQPEVQAWFTILLDAPHQDPRAIDGPHA